MEVTRRAALGLAGLIGATMAFKPDTSPFSQFLRLAFFRSPNYVAGVSGWTVNSDGSAEFNNLTIRGTFQGTNFLINASGAFFYSGVPAAGNLIGSIANAGGTDSHGNVYLAGVVRYDAALILAVQLNLGGIVFYTAPSEAGPWSQKGSIGDSLWAEPAGSAISLQIGAVTPLSMSGTLITAAVTLQGTLLEAFAPAAGSAALVAEVSGDTNPRFQALGSGKLQWGSGAAAVDTDLFRALAGVLQTDSTFAITNQAAPSALAGAAQLYAASGQIAAENPQGLLLNLSGAQLATVNVNTVTQTAFTNLASATVPAADAAVGAAYKIRAKGTGTWGSTQQQLNLGARFGAAATNVVAQASIMAAAFAASAAFAWQAEVEAVCVTTGVGGTWIVSITGCVTQTANAILPGTAADNSVPFAIVTSAPITLDTTVTEILGISASWGSTTGAPTISKRASIFGREA